MEKRATANLDWTFKGMRTLVLENRFLKVSILLDKGSDIFEMIFKPLDIDVIWHSSKGYRSPGNGIQSITDQADAFTDYYGGGWNDVFPNYGFASENRGTKFGLHGESSLLPWSCLGCEREEDAVRARLSLDYVRYPLHAEKSISLKDDESTLEISEDVINVGEQPIEFSWAQHIAFGEPFVSEDLSIEIPAKRATTHSYKMSHQRLVRNSTFD